MIYLIYGEDSLIKKEINDILSKEKNIFLTNYDLEETSIFKVVEDINTIDLFSNKKVFIVSNFNKIDNENCLLKYIKNKNDNILILTSDIIKEKDKIVKEIMKNDKVINVSSINLIDYIKENFKGWIINNTTINLLKDYCNNNYYRLTNEIEKLKLLKAEEKEITEIDIKNVVKKGLDANIFDLVNAINEKNKTKMFNIYYELLKEEDEIQIMGFLAKNFRLLYQVKVLIKEYSDEEIIKKLKINPYRFKILKRESYNYNELDLLKYLTDLSDLDLNIKSGVIDKKLGMELYLSKL